MSEGEFKRRVERYDKKMYLEWTDVEGVGWDVGKNHFIEWLEDAKKEFPIEDNYASWYETFCQYCETKEPCPPCYRYFDWFKKWFGEKK